MWSTRITADVACLFQPGAAADVTAEPSDGTAGMLSRSTVRHVTPSLNLDGAYDSDDDTAAKFPVIHIKPEPSPGLNYSTIDSCILISDSDDELFAAIDSQASQAHAPAADAADDAMLHSKATQDYTTHSAAAAAGAADDAERASVADSDPFYSVLIHILL